MRFRPGLVAVLVCLLYVQVQAQQPTPDQIAEQTLSSARRAYNEKQYPVAAQRFREYLQKFPQHRDINWGRYGLALALLDGPLADRDLKVVIDNLAAVSNEFSERPFSLYQLGYAYRLDAETRLAMAADKPNEAQQHRTAALDRYNNATSNYALAATLFERQAAAEPADKPSTSFPWAVRARLDTAEMLLLQGKFRETLDSTNPFILTDKYRKAPGGATGVYYQGYAYFMLKEYQRAGQTLISLAPFADPIVGPDTRYLLGRINHIQGDRLEAAAHYDAATTAYENLR
jgi:TolA-binding protein